MGDGELYFRGYRVTTLEITYHNPDFPDLLQVFIWQCFDLPPKFPKAKKFIEFWKREIVADLHSVNISNVDTLSEFTNVDLYIDI